MTNCVPRPAVEEVSVKPSALVAGALEAERAVRFAEGGGGGRADDHNGFGDSAL